MTGPVSCGACGERWPRHPALEVECPDCRAAVGVHCVKPSGHGFWDYELPHTSREQLALDRGIFRKCQASKSALPNAQTPLFGDQA